MKPLLAFSTVFLLLASSAHGETPWSGSSVFDDPEWRSRFLGSYGFLSGAEPDVRPDELEMLREVIDLLKANPRAAATVLSAQVKEDSSAALDFVLANIYFQNGELNEARRYYESAIEKFPDFRRAHKNLGLLKMQGGDYAGAVVHLGRAIGLGDRDGRSYGLMGYGYINLEKYFAAEQAYRSAILHQPDTRDWKLGLARSLLALEKHREAIGLFDGLLEGDPTDAKVWMLQANAYLGLDEPLKAAVALEAVQMMGKADHNALSLLGNIYMTEGMTALAKASYLAAIETDAGRERYEPAYRAAELLIRTQAYEEAAEVLASIDARYASKLTNDQELKLLTLKAKLARAQGRQREAAKLLESIVQRDGTRGEALIELAHHYHGQGDDARALLLISRAEKLSGFEYDALLAHAQFRVAARDYQRAAELLRGALEIRREARVERFLARVEQAARS